MQVIYRCLVALALSVPFGLLLAPYPAPSAPQEKPAPSHGRGYKPPTAAVSTARHAKSDALHSNKLHLMANKAKVVGIPATYDSVGLGLVPPIQDQGQCGSCHIFSAIGVCTIAQYVSGVLPAGTGANGSEQWMMDCLNTGDCNGGDEWSNCQMVLQGQGFPTAADYGPYMAYPKQCKQSVPLKFKIVSQAFCTPGAGPNSIGKTADIQACVMQYGAVSVACAASSAAWNDPGSKVMIGNDNQVDHAVIIVGWKPSTTPGKVAWKVRNSWGTSWGDGGYCWIEEGSFAIGTEAFFVSAGAAPPTPPGPTPPGPTPPGPVPPTPAGPAKSVTITYADGTTQTLTTGGAPQTPATITLTYPDGSTGTFVPLTLLPQKTGKPSNLK